MVRETVLRALVEQPLSEAALRKMVRRPTATLVAEVLDRLLKDGQVFRHPPLGRTKTRLHGAAPPDPLRYLATGLDRLVRDAVKLGFGEDAAKDAIARCAGAAGTKASGAWAARRGCTS